MAWSVEVAGAANLEKRAREGLWRAVEFFRSHVAVQGSYLWEYSEDLAKREGEGVAKPTRGWIQPPGTPSVGMAYLQAYQATGNAHYLVAAQETAEGLRQGQLASGGWTYYVDLDPGDRRRVHYRGTRARPRMRRTSTLDDDTTQAALRFLMRLDQTLGFRNERIHESTLFGLESVLAAQYPNGAWPQGYNGPADPDGFEVMPASYPSTWSRTWPGSGEYWFRYTLNDNVLANTIDLLLEAQTIYKAADVPAAQALAGRCRQAAQRGGDFLLLAQMPEPQPAWAQQYDFEMHPCWARKFEPPAVTGGESQGAMRILLQLFRQTAHRPYLEPIPRALAYLRQSRLPDGRLARFYELKSNRPLYFTRDYELTYDDDNMPGHYSFKVGDGTDAIAQEYERLNDLSPDELAKESQPASRPPRLTPALEAQVRTVLAAQDEQGRWVEPGPLRFHRPKDPDLRIIRSATFIQNVETLSRYLRAVTHHGRQASP